jgi:hypothetical protein
LNLVYYHYFELVELGGNWWKLVEFGGKYPPLVYRVFYAVDV